MQRVAGLKHITTSLKMPGTVSLGRKNFLFFGSDHGEHGALLYSLIGTCKLNGVDQRRFRHVLNVIADWPVNLSTSCYHGE
jgi:transposase